MINHRAKTAFTLVELLVVIAIVGILSGLIIVGMSSSVKSATIAKAQIFSSSLRDSLLASLVSEWKFDEVGVPSANLTPDSWSSNNCTLTGPGGLPQLQTSGCMYNNCLSFDGVDDYLDCGNGSNLDVTTNSFTVEAWVKPSVLGGTLASKENCLSGNPGWELKFLANGKGQVGLNDGTYIIYPDIGSALSINTWYDVVFTLVRNGNAMKYVNGVLDGSVDISARSGSLSTAQTFKIGAYACGAATSSFFNGRIDNARVYNNSIPISKIRERYFTGLNELLANKEIGSIEYFDRIEEFITAN